VRRRVRVDTQGVQPLLGEPLNQRAVAAADLEHARAGGDGVEDDGVVASPPVVTGHSLRGYSHAVLEPERVVRLEPDRVVLLDQRRLPTEEVELVCSSAAEVAEAIRSLAVRGAPAIGVAAGYGYALAVARGEDPGEAAAVLEAARPTAANLAWALREVRAAGDPEARARELHAEEIERCRLMSEHAAELLSPGTRALTHCNTGALATAARGTALGALREAWERGLLRHVFVDETRPLLQGARLTAWELESAGIPHTVIADSAAGQLLAAGEVDAVVVGADRIAANGDTANKIGTYPLAVLAARHDVPFYVVAPTSTVDLALAGGEEIPIEQRDPAEVTARFEALNPAFDVTPAELISAIVTERGVHRAPYAESLAGAVPA
jgi:methylthioribose-1-phosphate isomerase